MSILLSPIQIGNLILKNRIVMSPMCQYSSVDGFVNDWHYVHYISRAVGGCSAIIQEATAVSRQGRISYQDLGIWKNEHICELKKLVMGIHKQGAVAGIQLAHAGRKGSCDLMWNGGSQIKSGINSWQTIAPSSIPFNEGDSLPKELSIAEIESVVSDFKDAAQRALEAGYKIIEIHAAHGYLIHQFLSPISNKRSDQYGGSFQNRVRFLLAIIDAIRSECDYDYSLWVRISATDWVDGGWNEHDSVKLAALLKEKGVDVIDVSTGGNVPHPQIPVAPGYQVPFAEKIKEATALITGTVGLITTPEQAENLLKENKCDLIFLGRELLRNPYFALHATKQFEEKNKYPVQYERAFK